MGIENKLEKEFKTIDGIDTVIVKYGRYSIFAINKNGSPYVKKVEPSNFGIIEKSLFRSMFRAASVSVGVSRVALRRLDSKTKDKPIKKAKKAKKNKATIKSQKQKQEKPNRRTRSFYVSDCEVLKIKNLLMGLRKKAH